jgi:hypothetical protein
VKREKANVKCKKESNIVSRLPSHISLITLCAMLFALCKKDSLKIPKLFFDNLKKMGAEHDPTAKHF